MNVLSLFRSTMSTSAFPRRTGLLATKIGMTAEWDANGTRVPLTVLRVVPHAVSQVKTEDTADGYTALQVAAITPSELSEQGVTVGVSKHISKPVTGHLAKAGIAPRGAIAEFRVTKEGLLPVGSMLSVLHFVPGQAVDLRGVTTGKGFQGVMKRWGFGGLAASHGVSVSHRSHGATGQRQDPGRVFKGKKMAGHMGHEWRTIQNLRVYKVDPSRGLLYVKGGVPGPDRAVVHVEDAIKNRDQLSLLPFPTRILADGEDLASMKPEVMSKILTTRIIQTQVRSAPKIPGQAKTAQKGTAEKK
ncbi:mitochondrial ribosomal protein L3 (uL3m) [Andalucia godoyi]|uniref:Large ribosomal subunit protein uL3m n=1 Tax=Andalucia godoyi TaxID=505711 RepID=A0A8K0AH97_ANDGO|nr:mitochondrial ribosomal protein L3 (uL3m) [Andalucia godoyi]|eukprot:ANDGO_00490.mRNA.1 mitochondrial ribosomal protein L3 (uL3m)